RQLCFVAADENRVGHHPVAVLERDAALGADRENRADQMLVHAHAAGDAVHDDAEPLLRHFNLAFCSCRTANSAGSAPTALYEIHWISSCSCRPRASGAP